MRISLDYDSVLVDIHTPWLNWVNEKYKTSYRVNDIKTWTFVSETLGVEATTWFKQKGIYANNNVMPIILADYFVEKLKWIVGKDNVFIVSHVQDGQLEEKMKHAKNYFNINNDHFFSSKDKWHYTKNSVLVDDYPLNVINHISYNGYPGVIFNHEKNYGWVNNWSDLPECKILFNCCTYSSTLDIIRNYFT